ncbi:hypothetical protein M501DRAFT_985134 [Patellaria atrata CBS 101060]|uniref:Uncharacterized protein n=1 Tax=Patellaria atrata CBS 101060 TaxID=1346257 RepID=A0A9P4SI75_9PEZI|nr:hypothetical protein M501DRAFT_985134 [Patellaria atrata CBS 101060]
MSNLQGYCCTVFTPYVALDSRGDPTLGMAEKSIAIVQEPTSVNRGKEGDIRIGQIIQSVLGWRNWTSNHDEGQVYLYILNKVASIFPLQMRDHTRSAILPTVMSLPMLSEEFLESLNNTLSGNPDDSRCRTLYEYTRTVYEADLSTNLAQKYLAALSDAIARKLLGHFLADNISNLSRRWAGLLLVQLLEKSEVAGYRICDEKHMLKKLGQNVFKQSEDLKLITGMIIKPLVKRGLCEIGDFWSLSPSFQGPTSFPTENSQDWIGKYQEFMDSLFETDRFSLGPEAFFVVDLTADGDTSFTEESGNIMLSIVNERATFMIPQTSKQLIQVVEVPIQNINVVQRQPSTLRNPKGEEIDVCRLSLILRDSAHGYLLNAQRTKAAVMTITFPEESTMDTAIKALSNALADRSSQPVTSSMRASSSQVLNVSTKQFNSTDTAESRSSPQKLGEMSAQHDEPRSVARDNSPDDLYGLSDGGKESQARLSQRRANDKGGHDVDGVSSLPMNKHGDPKPAEKRKVSSKNRVDAKNSASELKVTHQQPSSPLSDLRSSAQASPPNLPLVKLKPAPLPTPAGRKESLKIKDGTVFKTSIGKINQNTLADRDSDDNVQGKPQAGWMPLKPAQETNQPQLGIVRAGKGKLKRINNRSRSRSRSAALERIDDDFEVPVSEEDESDSEPVKKKRKKAKNSKNSTASAHKSKESSNQKQSHSSRITKPKQKAGQHASGRLPPSRRDKDKENEPVNDGGTHHDGRGRGRFPAEEIRARRSEVIPEQTDELNDKSEAFFFAHNDDNGMKDMEFPSDSRKRESSTLNQNKRLLGRLTAKVDHEETPQRSNNSVHDAPQEPKSKKTVPPFLRPASLAESPLAVDDDSARKASLVAFDRNGARNQGYGLSLIQSPITIADSPTVEVSQKWTNGIALIKQDYIRPDEPTMTRPVARAHNNDLREEITADKGDGQSTVQYQEQKLLATAPQQRLSLSKTEKKAFENLADMISSSSLDDQADEVPQNLALSEEKGVSSPHEPPVFVNMEDPSVRPVDNVPFDDTIIVEPTENSFSKFVQPLRTNRPVDTRKRPADTEQRQASKAKKGRADPIQGSPIAVVKRSKMGHKLPEKPATMKINKPQVPKRTVQITPVSVPTNDNDRKKFSHFSESSYDRGKVIVTAEGSPSRTVPVFQTQVADPVTPMTHFSIVMDEDDADEPENGDQMDLINGTERHDVVTDAGIEEVLSSNRKPPPGHPEAESRAISSYLSKEELESKIAKAVYNEEKSPFEKVSKSTQPIPSLLQAFLSIASRKRDLVAEIAPPGHDAEQNFTDEREPGENLTLPTNAGKSSSTETSSQVEDEEVEDTDVLEWAVALKPHHRGVVDALISVVRGLLRHLDDAETVLNDMINDYEKDGLRVLGVLEEQRRQAHEARIESERIVIQQARRDLQNTLKRSKSAEREQNQDSGLDQSMLKEREAKIQFGVKQLQDVLSSILVNLV